ncbi:MAG: aconitate hydratase [Thermodesulfobacteriota bacterium]
MGENLVEKIIREHKVSGNLCPGETVSISTDQVLTQDATGTMTYLQFEAMDIPRVQVPLVVSYVDHNMLQTDFKNPDDHLFLQSTAAKYGAYFSKPGNGICHQVHLERFAVPGQVLLGTDSHTPTAGGMGVIAIGAGGLDIAAVMARGIYEFRMPKVILIRLTGKLNRPWVTAMDVIMEILRILSVKGGVGKIIEYGGPGVDTLSVTERATIANMGVELGATTSIFPSDERTKRYLKAQNRDKDWRHIKADEDASYDEELNLDLSRLEPLVTQPHSPDNVVKIKELKGTRVDQVCIGSCTNSSYQVLKSVSSILRGKTVAPWCSMTVSPGSKQVYEMIAREGDLSDIIASGARILEPACGPCIGMGQSPSTDGISVRSFNRNFKGRSGTDSAMIYLCNPLAATAIAIKGTILDPMEIDLDFDEIEEPKRFLINDNMILPPSPNPEDVHIIRGPNIKEIPVKGPLEDDICCTVLIKVGDNITTDDIMPASSNILPLRSNIPAISEFVFSRIDKDFAKRAKEMGGGVIIGGENYGQGSSREHAALAPMYLGVKAVIARSFARIHRSNLINYGIVPFEFEKDEDYQRIEEGNLIEVKGIREGLGEERNIALCNKSKGINIPVKAMLTLRESEILKAGGVLRWLKMH